MFLLIGIGENIQESLDVLSSHMLGPTVNHKFTVSPEDSRLSYFDMEIARAFFGREHQ
jgi:hypothetical protein